ncbi:MAG: hypothetical protein LBS97_02155 [Treponema sp.]|nr:hypothetical protein [Treponema sp.]
MLLLVSVCLSSCATSEALYLRLGAPEREAPPDFPRPSYRDEDIHGDFPEAVYIKTRTQTFNTYQYYLIKDALIWYKSIESEKEPHDWTLFEKTGLPHNERKPGFAKPRAIVEISADADELVALSDDGGFYRFCFDKTIAHASNVWLDKQGWPKEEQLFLDERTSKNRAWALGKRNNQVLYYEDPFGNQHHNGTMEIATAYVLLEDGQEICYADTGLPSDFSRNYIGPERGAFKAASLSASASTLFVINEAGEMYTRMADFDITGSDPMFFKYAYTPYTSDVPGTSYLSNLTEWALPSEDWRAQPPISLVGKAALTRHITILQNGQGNGARELRVAGLDEQGVTGYWTKAIFDESWAFRAAALHFSDAAFLQAANEERGLSLDKRYSGYWWDSGIKEEGWEYEIPNFNILEGDCDFRVTWRGEICTLKLHPAEMWAYLTRDYVPGRTGSPKMFLVTLEIPNHAFDGLSEGFTQALTAQYLKNDRKLFQYTVAASSRFLLLRDTGRLDSVLFLTDGSISNSLAEFRPSYLVEGFAELPRYLSPELAYAPGAVLTADDKSELANKIEANRLFRHVLKYQIRALKWSELTAFKINFGYIPLHYITRLTPLRFIDVPKIRTVTEFGDKIVLANSAYNTVIANLRIVLYEEMIKTVETRIKSYRASAKQLAKGAESVLLPVATPVPMLDYLDSLEFSLTGELTK